MKLREHLEELLVDVKRRQDGFLPDEKTEAGRIDDRRRLSERQESFHEGFRRGFYGCAKEVTKRLGFE